jgi:outer membrane immunogenic protein
MKTLLLSTCAALSVVCTGAAVAADLPIKAPAPVVVAAPWTGCGLGFNVGGAFGDSWWSNTNPAYAGSYSLSGAVAGAQLYCDYQTGPLVIGLEGNYAWSSLDGNGTTPNATTHQTTINSIGGAGGRVGLAVDKALIYVRAQAVWAQIDHTQILGVTNTISDTRVGWGIGAGIEYMIAPVLTARLEYNYDDFGSKDFTYANLPALPYTEQTRFHIMKLGLNYKFW